MKLQLIRYKDGTYVIKKEVVEHFYNGFNCYDAYANNKKLLDSNGRYIFLKSGDPDCIPDNYKIDSLDIANSIMQQIINFKMPEPDNGEMIEEHDISW